MAATNEVTNGLFRSESPRTAQPGDSFPSTDIGVSGAAKMWGGRADVGPLQGHKKGLGGAGRRGVIGTDVFLFDALSRGRPTTNLPTSLYTTDLFKPV